MDEYISKKDILQMIESTATWNRSFSVLYEDIEDMKPADVSPVRHGRWENGNPICPVCGGDKFKDIDADIWSDWKPAFCPNCGAKMDGGAD